MLNTFQNSAQVLSIGVFFTLIILGLAPSLPQALYSGLVAQGVPSTAAHQAAALPPVASLFAAFLGYNPIRTLLGPAFAHLPATQVAFLTGRSFFPHLIAAPFASGLAEAFTFAMIACLVAAAASWLRGGKYHHPLASGTTSRDEKTTPPPTDQLDVEAATATPATAHNGSRTA